MILKVLPDTGQVMHRIDVEFAQMVARTNPGMHQNMRRSVGACRQHHLGFGRDPVGLPALDVFDPARRLTLDHHTCDSGVGHDMKVRPTHGGTQIGAKRRATPGVALGD